MEKLNIDYNFLASTNYLTKYYKFYDDQIYLLLLTAHYASVNLQRYNPRFEDENKWKKFINDCNNKAFLNLIKIYENDVNLYNENKDYYEFIVMTLYTSQINLNKIKENEFLTIYSVKNNAIVEKKFENMLEVSGKSSLLFHGSYLYNWYSIIRNGIKIYSGTELQTNGNVYGNGIYLSDSIQFSERYSNCSLLSSSFFKIIGIYELIGDKNKYTKASNIFVCEDEKMLILRYIIILNKEIPNYIYSELNNMLNEKNRIAVGKKIIENSKLGHQISIIENKRLKKNYVELMTNMPDYINSIELVDDNINVWIIELKMDDETNKDEQVVKDMEKYNIKFIKLILYFNDFPFSPPFIHIITPRFQRITGHITSGGSICAEFLTNQGWSPTRIELIVLTIKSIIFEGNGRIDENWNIPYTLQEAQNSYKIMLNKHGWV